MAELRVAVAQIAPVFLDRQATLEKVANAIKQAAAEQVELIAFGEACVPGYPIWLERTGGATFNDPFQKDIHAHYIAQAVDPAAGDLQAIQKLAEQHQIAIYLGIIERAADRGDHSLFASLVFIDHDGTIGSVHRKLCPTYDERLVWSPGDGHGLRTHTLGEFKVGGLNCWENWMPLPRAALYAQGETVHIASWPGSKRNTEDITRYLAKEGRSFVLSASNLLRPQDLPQSTPGYDQLIAKGEEFYTDGGSCIAAPDGSWIIEPFCFEEDVRIAAFDPRLVRRERQNFDPAGHYSRPDVTQVQVDRRRQNTAVFRDE